MAALPSYVLITPARNEAQFIGLTLEAVVSQTVLPVRWVIVSDGSTDGTDDVVRKYTDEHPWIELVHLPERRERSFAGKVRAFRAGYAKLQDVEYEVIGSLDADISFDRDYFSFLLGQLAQDTTLGLVGTPFRDGPDPPYDYRFTNIEHVSGACQLFRRECFEDIGGYVPVKEGCIDHIAVISARMKGWRTRTFTDKVCLHHRTMGTATRGQLLARFANGQKDHAIGNHPIWEVCRTVYQMTKRPLIIGGLMLVSGYVWACVRRRKRPVSDDFVVFVRREQVSRLKRVFTRRHAVGARAVVPPVRSV